MHTCVSTFEDIFNKQKRIQLNSQPHVPHPRFQISSLPGGH